MTARQLRDELARIAEGAPEVEVAPDTYPRARRAVARGRAVVVAGVVVIVMVGAVVLPGFWPTADEPPVVSDGPELGVPDRIEAVPNRLADFLEGETESHDVWKPDVVEKDLAIGTAAAAYLTDRGLPVVIGAADGAYHLLELPGFGPQSTSSIIFSDGAARPGALALSPDGRSLAWAWAGPGANGTRPTGVRVADLGTGKIRDVRIDSDQGVLVESLAWSPDSSWLAWHGIRTKQWTASSWGGTELVAGKISPGDTVSTAVEWSNEGGDIAVSDSGVIGRLTDRQLRAGDDHMKLDPRTGGGYEWYRGGVWFHGEAAYAMVHDSEGDRGSRVFSLADGAEHALPSVGGWQPQALAMIDGRRVVVAEFTAVPGQVQLVDLETGEARPVIEIGNLDDGAGGVNALTLALDLMPADRPTVARPAPDWPRSVFDTPMFWIGVAVLGVVLLAAAGVLRRRVR